MSELKQAKSALRWITVAVLFVFLALLTEIVGIVLFALDVLNIYEQLYWRPIAVTSVGSMVLMSYAKWCANCAKPKSWGKL